MRTVLWSPLVYWERLMEPQALTRRSPPSPPTSVASLLQAAVGPMCDTALGLYHSLWVSLALSLSTILGVSLLFFVSLLFSVSLLFCVSLGGLMWSLEPLVSNWL